MSVDLQLDKMTVDEKLEIMERIWEDLSRTPSEIASPHWHREVLENRKREVSEGKSNWIAFDDAMKELREELRGNSSP